MLNKKLVFALGIFAIILSACSAATGEGKGAASADLEIAPVENALAPDFELTDFDGNVVRLSDYRGKVVLVNFWATWCPPCIMEMPVFQDRFEKYGGEDFVILALDADETEAPVQDFIAQNGLSFPVVIDAGAAVYQLYQVRGLPSSFFIDEDGVVRTIHIGVMTEEQLDGYLAQLGIVE